MHHPVEPVSPVNPHAVRSSTRSTRSTTPSTPNTPRLRGTCQTPLYSRPSDPQEPATFAHNTGLRIALLCTPDTSILCNLIKLENLAGRSGEEWPACCTTVPQYCSCTASTNRLPQARSSPQHVRIFAPANQGIDRTGKAGEPGSAVDVGRPKTNSSIFQLFTIS